MRTALVLKLNLTAMKSLKSALKVDLRPINSHTPIGDVRVLKRTKIEQKFIINQVWRSKVCVENILVVKWGVLLCKC